MLTSGRTLPFSSLFTESGTVSFHFEPCRCAAWRGGGGERRRGRRKKRQGREKRDGELRTPLMFYKLTQADTPNLAIKMLLK